MFKNPNLVKTTIAKSIRWTLFASATWLAYTPSFAQSTKLSDQMQDAQLKEIVVTVQRRKEELQTVPIALTALTGSMLRNSGIQDTLALQQNVPDFVMTTNATEGQPYLRGVGTDIINEGTDPSIAVYEDGVYQARAAASIAELYDVKRVEVVMGPQGTLFGRNATGGAISIINNEPVNKFESSGDLQIGNYNNVRIADMLNLPVSDKVAVRVAGFYDYRDGFSKNVNLSTRIDGVNVWGARGKLRIQPNENVTFILTGEYSDDRSTRNMAPVVDSNLFAPAVNVFGALPNTDPRQVRYNVQPGAQVTQSKVYGTLVWQIGGAELKSITAYNSMLNNISALDLDSTEINFLSDSLDEHSKVFTQELQLASNAEGPLHWVTGLYYLHEIASQLFPISLSIPVIPGPKPDAVIRYDTGIHTEAYSAFGQASYRIGKVRLTAGLRYSHETKNSGFNEAVTDPYYIVSPLGSMAVNNPQRRGWKAWTPKADIDYFVNDDVMLYVGASEGFKSGGMNLQGAGEVFSPETLWDYEGGIKATWFNGKFRTNLDGFYYDYKNLQVSVYNGATSVVTNIPKSTIRGFEANVTALPVPDFSIDLHLALLDAKIGQYSTLNPNTGLVQDVSGNILPRAPKTSFTAGAEYTLPDQQYGRITLRGEMKYQSNIFFTYYDNPEVSQGGFTVFNARLSYERPGNRWYAAVFGNNLTNKLYRASVIQSQSTIGTLLFWGPPRTFGLDVGYKF